MAKHPKSITTYRLTDHARFEMVRRQISEAEVESVLAGPEQAECVREGRAVYQSLIELGEPSKTYLLRVVVDIDRQPPEVVTVYRSSKVQKYWRGET
ncbi:MAG: DUF4258 domain-containing protein [Candidatus Entotheonellia bacterium]